MSEAVARAPHRATSLSAMSSKPQLNPADAGVSEIRAARARPRSSTIWGADVTLRIAIDPGDRDSIDACLAPASSGVAKFRYVETRQVN